MSTSTVVTIETGPAVAAGVALGPGRHVIGRSASASVCVDDPLIEPHHVLVHVADDGAMRLLQIAGRLPVLVDGVAAAGDVAVEVGTCLDVGASRLRLAGPMAVGEPPHTGEVPGDPWRRMVVRSPRAVPFVTVPAVELPTPDDGAASARGGHPGALVGAAGGLATGLVMALVTGSMFMAVFGVVAASVSTATWVTGRVRAARDRARRARRRIVDLERFERDVVAAAGRLRTHHLATVASVADRLAGVETSELWSRRAEHGDGFDVTLGRGDVERPVPIAGDTIGTLADDLAALLERHRVVRDVPVSISLARRPREVLAVERGAGAGDGDAAAIVRSLILQLAVSTGPADWCVRAMVRDVTGYGWIERLPHASTIDGRPAVVDAGDPTAVADAVLGLADGDDRRVVVVCDAPSLLATRTGPLRRLLDGERPVTVVLEVDDGTALPAVCTSAVTVGARSVARWVADLHDATATWRASRVNVAGVALPQAERLARRLERYVDPEDPSSAAGRLPTVVALGDLAGVPVGVDAIVAGWAALGADPAPSAVVGASVDGVIEIDLVRDGPHGLVAGTTGSGKSELLRALTLSLALRVPPSQLAFVLVDYKGGSTFDALAELPHTVGVVTDLDDGLAERALVSLEAELHRRERILRDHAAIDLAAYRAQHGVAPLARLVVVIDEFAALAKELPGFLSSLVGIAQRGRSLGIHLVLATQRPAGVIDDAIRANTNLRLALRLHDVADAVDVVGDRTPATFPRGVPGRSLLRLGPDDVVEFQAAAAGELDAVVSEVREAARRLAVPSPHRPWLPPLGEEAGPALVDAEPDAVGIIDDPAGQRRLPLRWDATGNLALVGALGSGTTTGLLALGVAIATRSRGDASPELHVVDGRGDDRLAALERSARCSGVVGVHEHERLDRMLRRLTDDIDRRRTPDSASTGPTVLLVDGLTTVRRSLDDPARASTLALLDRVLAEGPAVGVVTAAVVEPEGGAVGTLLTRFAERWVFHLDDAGVAPLLGLPSARVPPPVPGRLVVASSRLAAQIDPPDVDAVAAEAGPSTRVERVRVLPASVGLADLEPQGPGATVVGMRFDDLSTARLDLVGGDRLVVAGPARTGRSLLLVHLTERWRAEHPTGTVLAVCDARRSPLAALHGSADPAAVGSAVEGATARGLHLLVVVDDAERVDDVGGVLARLAAARPGGAVSLYVAGRADALRSTYDHWTTPARKQRTGFVMAATADIDADVLATSPPRRCPIPPRPGLAWMVAHGECALVQVVSPSPARRS